MFSQRRGLMFAGLLQATWDGGELASQAAPLLLEAGQHNLVRGKLTPSCVSQSRGELASRLAVVTCGKVWVSGGGGVGEIELLPLA